MKVADGQFMSKALTSILFFSALICSDVRAESRSCRPASDYDLPHGANELVEYGQIKVTRMQGRIEFGSSEGPANNIVVEVFEIKDLDGDRDLYRVADARSRLAACVTGKDGEFRFSDLPSGRYLVRAGTRQAAGWNFAYITIKLDRAWWKDWFRRGKRIELVLTVGT